MRAALHTFPALTFYFLETPDTEPRYVEQFLIDALGPPANQIRAAAVGNLEALRATLCEARPAQRSEY